MRQILPRLCVEDTTHFAEFGRLYAFLARRLLTFPDVFRRAENIARLPDRKTGGDEWAEPGGDPGCMLLVLKETGLPRPDSVPTSFSCKDGYNGPLTENWVGGREISLTVARGSHCKAPIDCSCHAGRQDTAPEGDGRRPMQFVVSGWCDCLIKGVGAST